MISRDETGETMTCQSLTEFFAKVGEAVETGGNRPFFLAGPDSLWWVETGEVEVFFVIVENGEPVGQRHFFCSVGAGGCLPGMDMERYGAGRGFLAVGTAGTRLLHLSREHLREAAAQPQLAREVADLVDGWVMALSRGVAQDAFPGMDDCVVTAGETAVLKTYRNVHAAVGVAWLETMDSQALFLGMEEIPSGPAGRCFPVTRNTWITVLRECAITFKATADLVGRPAFWDGLDDFYELLLACEAMNRRMALADELNRLHERDAGEQRTRDEADAHLSSVLKGAYAGVEARAGGDHLLAACFLVGSALGLDIRPHPGAREGRVSMDPLGDIARASRVRVRRVRLEGDWWRRDAGPLLAFRSAGSAPVALLPESARKMFLRDPAAGVTLEVDASVVVELEPYGYVFYRSLPERALEGSDILQFVVGNAAGEFRSVLILGLLCGLISALIPLAVRHILEHTAPGVGAASLPRSIGLVLLLSVLAGSLFEAVRNITLLRVEGKVDAVLQPALMDRLLRLPLSFFKEYSSGDLTDRALCIASIRQRLSGATMISLLGVVFAFFHFAILFYFDYRLALVVAALACLAGCANLWGSWRQARHLRPAVELEGKIGGMVFQFISAMSKLRVAGAETHAFAWWAKEFTRQQTWMVKSRRVGNLLTTLNGSLGFVVLFCVFVLFSVPSFQRMATGDFVAFNTAMLAFVGSMLTASASLASILGVVPLYDRVKPLLAAVPECSESRAHPGELSGAIEVSDLSFRYHPDGPLVLDDVSLSVQPGELVAFVGPSGSGKSTLMRLLLGFEVPDAGTISYDGLALSALDVEAVRRQIGVVLQDGDLAPGDIYSNITGSLPLTLEDARQAARLAGIEEEIQALPMGMQTMVSAGGKTFSGGQKQRLLIARALATKPRMLFFDEATSALDNRSQAAVSENIGRLQVTRVVVAHRLSTVIHADRIYVFDGGKIVQSGSFEELMSRDGLFSELARRQIAVGPGRLGSFGESNRKE